MSNYENFLDALSAEINVAYTENGAKTLATSGSNCLDLFATIGALRNDDADDIWCRFFKAYCENPTLAMKILFYARDVRGGLGERDVFRKIISRLANANPTSVRKNLKYISEFGRWDDVICLLGTTVHDDVITLIHDQLVQDANHIVRGDIENLSLIGKWLPSINTSSKKTVAAAKTICRGLHIKEREYRKMLTLLRKNIQIIENNLRKKEYTFDYSKQPSGAMLKYRKAFIRNDGARYAAFMDRVEKGEETIHTGTLYPYDIVSKIINDAIDGWSWQRHAICRLSEAERKSLDITWKNLENFADNRNSLCVIDGSGSMYHGSFSSVNPINIAISLGLYFAERNTGLFKDHFITFSTRPQLVKVEGSDITDRVRNCMLYNECSDTNIQAVFDLILDTAVKHNLPQSELPETVYIISDMEFNFCTRDASVTNFEYAKEAFKNAGYKLPNLVFWNVDSRNTQQPVKMDETGTALVSGCSPRIFSMVASGETDPVKFMESVILSKRYEMIVA